MPTLAQSIPSNDIGFLRIVASLWGIELGVSDAAEAAVELAETLCDAELLEEVVSTLPDASQNALGALVDAGGRLPWVVFARRFGDVREMGHAKRDREQPHERPNSAAEVLWYRALIAKAFFDTEKGPQEFAYIPDDLRDALVFIGFVQDEPQTTPNPIELPAARQENTLGRPASPGEKTQPIPATDRLLDDATTLLAALRLGVEPPETPVLPNIVSSFLEAAKILVKGKPQPEAVKKFLELPRAEALTLLESSWRASKTFNELRQLPGLVFEGGWINDPLAARAFILPLVESLPAGQWWSIAAFVRDLKARHADFQRPAPGDYDTWFIKRGVDGAYLRGFEHWESVDGALARYLLQVLHWLGRVDLAAPDASAAPTAFRLANAEARAASPEQGKIVVTSNGRITVERIAPRAVRYQVARFCAWGDEKDDEYRYRVTAGSLKRAAEQGLKAGQLLSLLARHSGGQIPPAFAKMLQRWEANGTEARVETLTVLKVSRPDVLEELRKSKAGRFLGEIVGPTTVRIPGDAIPKVLAALAELGLLAENVEE
jgi:hypothetical protein